MKIEDHLRNIKESIEVINESLEKGIENRQRNIGFNTSVASVEMLEVFLHKKKFLNPSLLLKHNWFSSIRKANEKIPFNFEDKEKIINLLNKIELQRNLLCYGKPKPIELIKETLQNFNKIKRLFEEKGLKWD
jgi:hypothetical protein